MEVITSWESISNLSYDKEIINLSYELMEVKLNGKKSYIISMKWKKELTSKIKNKELNSEINWGWRQTTHNVLLHYETCLTYRIKINLEIL